MATLCTGCGSQSLAVACSPVGPLWRGFLPPPAALACSWASRAAPPPASQWHTGRRAHTPARYRKQDLHFRTALGLGKNWQREHLQEFRLASACSCGTCKTRDLSTLRPVPSPSPLRRTLPRPAHNPQPKQGRGVWGGVGARGLRLSIPHLLWLVFRFLNGWGCTGRGTIEWPTQLASDYYPPAALVQTWPGPK